MLLSELLTAERVRVPLKSHSKDALLRELVELAAAGRDPSVVDAILTSVREREQVLSTGIGAGVAIPHGKTTCVDELVLSAGVSPVPVDFDALDGQPVQLFFLLVGPESASARGREEQVAHRVGGYPGAAGRARSALPRGPSGR